MATAGTRPTIRQLEYVVAVAEHESFSRAAEACGVSQPALSAQIQEVEQRLGVQLFERSRAGVTVPTSGRSVIELARTAIRAVDDVVIAAGQTSDEITGPLRVGVIPTMAPYLLPTLVTELRRRHPHAEPHLAEVQTLDLVAQLERGDLDLGLLAAPVPSARLTVTTIAEDPFHVAMSDDHPYAGDGPLPAGELTGLDMVLLEDGHCLRDQAIDYCDTAGVDSSGRIQATSLATLCQMVAAGRGVTLLPESSLGVETRPGSGIVSRPLRDPAPSRTVVLAWRPGSPSAALYARFAAASTPALAGCCRH